MTFQLTEPHPSVPRTNYIHSGRGGAGNYARVSPSTITAGATASGPASRTVLPPSTGNFAVGRGGAGNFKHASERAIFSFDEELERSKVQEERQAPVYHIGRGGAGNWAESQPRAASVRVGSADSRSSSDSHRSERSDKRDSVSSRISRVFNRA